VVSESINQSGDVHDDDISAWIRRIAVNPRLSVLSVQIPNSRPRAP
jgi:hypothetical protein